MLTFTFQMHIYYFPQQKFKRTDAWFQFSKRFVFDHVNMRGEMNWNRYEISIRLKISLHCLVSSLLVFIWIEAKCNSRRYGFHIVHFNRSEVSNWYEIFTWTEFSRSEMARWILRVMRMCVWNSFSYGFHNGHLDRNEISFRLSPVWVHIASRVNVL